MRGRQPKKQERLVTMKTQDDSGIYNITHTLYMYTSGQKIAQFAKTTQISGEK